MAALKERLQNRFQEKLYQTSNIKTAPILKHMKAIFLYPLTPLTKHKEPVELWSHKLWLLRLQLYELQCKSRSHGSYAVHIYSIKLLLLLLLLKILLLKITTSIIKYITPLIFFIRFTFYLIYKYLCK